MFQRRVPGQECRCRHYLARQQEQVTGLQRAVRQVADAEGDVDAVADDVVAAVVAGDAEVEVGMLLDEGCQVTGEVAVDEHRGHRDAQAVAGRDGALAELDEALLVEFQHGAGGVQQLRAVLGQRQLAAVAVEQRTAQVPFQPGQVQAGGRGAQAQRLGAAGDGAGLGDLGEYDQVADVVDHAVSRRGAGCILRDGGQPDKRER